MNNKDLIRDLNKRGIPIVKIDENLDKYKDIPIFQDKANEMLKKVGLPKLHKEK